MSPSGPLERNEISDDGGSVARVGSTTHDEALRLLLCLPVRSSAATAEARESSQG